MCSDPACVLTLGLCKPGARFGGAGVERSGHVRPLGRAGSPDLQRCGFTGLIRKCWGSVRLWGPLLPSMPLWRSPSAPRLCLSLPPPGCEIRPIGNHFLINRGPITSLIFIGCCGMLNQEVLCQSENSRVVCNSQRLSGLAV